jgi:asparagine synthase (glutamine-hydrolysing)
MCGIAGFEIRASDFESVARTLLAELDRRGPDGAWARCVGSWGLVQTRLAVIDLSPAVQYPMTNESENLWLLFNGEVYNHSDLRRELHRRGHSFRTGCDAEVVVHGYEEWGDGVFRRLNGMWALALLDGTCSELVLARDARGVKPLAMTTGERFAFASDVIALVAAGLSAGAIDHDSIAEYAAFHYVGPPGTGLRDVQQIPPGGVVKRRSDGRTTTDIWAAPLFVPRERGRVPDEEADRTLRCAVERQLAADVPVGVFLSGGVDSALVLGYAVELGHRPTAFTVGFEGAGDYDETRAASELARRLGIEHQVDILRAGFAETVELVGSSFDSPFGDPSAIAMLPLARFARREVTVALSGTGGDDFFAGYYRHRANRLRRLFARVPTALRRFISAPGARRGAERTHSLSLAASYAKRMAATSVVDDREFYLSLIGSSTSPNAAGLFLDGASLEAARARIADRHGVPAGRALSLDELQEFELQTYLAGNLLVKEDRATMAWGLEARVPWLDEEVARLAARTPESQRATLFAGKVLLRRMARRRLGRRVAATRKRGFAVPLGLFFARGWNTEACEWLPARSSELIDTSQAAKIVKDAESNPLDLWALCALLAWERRLAEARSSTGFAPRAPPWIPSG